MKPLPIQFLPAATCLALAASAASAASPEAWKEFRAEVEKRCLAATSSRISEPAAWVDPFGSESHGIAIVSGKSNWVDLRLSFVCIYDEQTGKVELSGEIPGDLVEEASRNEEKLRE